MCNSVGEITAQTPRQREIGRPGLPDSPRQRLPQTPDGTNGIFDAESARGKEATLLNQQSTATIFAALTRSYVHFAASSFTQCLLKPISHHASVTQIRPVQHGRAIYDRSTVSCTLVWPDIRDIVVHAKS
jgi:hypothetical protein